MLEVLCLGYATSNVSAAPSAQLSVQTAQGPVAAGPSGRSPAVCELSSEQKAFYELKQFTMKDTVNYSYVP